MIELCDVDNIEDFLLEKIRKNYVLDTLWKKIIDNFLNFNEKYGLKDGILYIVEDNRI